MQAPPDALRAEVDAILARDLSGVATARDLPRLHSRVRVHLGEQTAPPSASSIELLRTLAQVLGDGTPVAECADEGDTVRALGRVANARLSMALKCVSQNAIAPAVVRLKQTLAAAGVATKDSEWTVDIHVEPVLRVVHTRSEAFLDGTPACRWQLHIVQNGEARPLWEEEETLLISLARSTAWSC